MFERCERALYFSTPYEFLLLYMLTHDKRRIHKLKPVLKIKSLYNEKRLPQVPVSFYKKCLRNVSIAVSPHYIFFVIGNTNRIDSSDSGNRSRN